MPNQSSISSGAILSALVTLVAGGLAGAIFLTIVNRPKLTILTYSISTTSWAAPEARTLIPNIKVQIGNETIKALYAHNIDFGVPRGPFAKSVEVAITFPERIRIYGKSIEAPSKVQTITCEELDDGLRCTMSSLAPGPHGNYRVVIATGEKRAPKVDTVEEGIELRSLAEFLEHEKGLGATGFGIPTFIIALAASLASLFAQPLVRFLKDRITNP